MITQSENNAFYVYLHRRNDTGKVFYVGKGTPELMDIVYTVSGGLVVVVMLTAAAELLATVNQC